ncbi:PREDICTED: uncharacterized protein LOC109152623 [Ipomoea nil]|uniref:uncharacterized protein LOC109152623 n=1 Tax=Ipomoea nil TaxID=35883 RepID=UPI000900A6AF|nr:PREDICTED: uncharacterized protein LOC109152623 [Ipomoea nil]
MEISPEDDEDFRFVLVSKLLTNKIIKFNFMKETMTAVWRLGRGLVVTELAPNLFILQLFHEVDMNRILEDGPWLFEHSLLVLARLQPNVPPHDVPLDKVVATIGNFVGTFIQSDKNNFYGSWKSFLRIRVTLDITKPLTAKMRIKRKDVDWSWISFRYERLPHFCFICRMIGHT